MNDRGERLVRAAYTGETITVCQACSPQIADAAVAAGTFLAPFSRERMTWIKPSFGWMMQRCGWARKPGQERVLAITLGQPGSPEQPVNDSKGCGGVMRVAPIGLAAADPFTLGCQAAALTHGHPAGYRAAGALELMVAEIIRGTGLRPAAAAAITQLRLTGDNCEAARALQSAVTAADSQSPTPETVERLGQGWVADEALAIALYCALTAPGFSSGVLLAVNHGGDSDSTGAICGNLLGAALSSSAIDPDLLAGLEGRDVIEHIADSLYELVHGNAERRANATLPGQARRDPGR